MWFIFDLGHNDYTLPSWKLHDMHLWDFIFEDVYSYPDYDFQTPHSPV